MRKIKYSIVTDEIENGLPTFFVLKSIYFFGVNLIGQLFGIDGSSEIPFQTFEQAVEFKKILENLTQKVCGIKTNNLPL